MDSLWIDIKDNDQTKSSPPYLGVFMEDPMIIGQNLPRPTAPNLSQIKELIMKKDESIKETPLSIYSPPEYSGCLLDVETEFSLTISSI